MTILVTGGAGYIGSHTCVELLNTGHDIIIVDSMVNAKHSVLSSIEKITGRSFVFIQADVRDKEAMHNIFASQPIDAVIHFAGLKSVGESVGKPLEYYDNNFIGTVVLLNTMRAFDVKKLVFSSSATVYGMDNQVPFREDMPTSATNPYGYTKVMIERLLFDLAHSDSTWAISTLRYFNPIGAHASGLIGEDPAGIPNNIFPYIAQVAAGKLPLIRIYGDDYDTPDGTGVRDYIHVVDLALGHLSALAYTGAHAGIKAINLGTGTGTSVLELIAAFEKACGCALPRSIEARRPGDVATSYADPSLAHTLLRWQATRNIEDMCVDGWRFVRMQDARDAGTGGK